MAGAYRIQCTATPCLWVPCPSCQHCWFVILVPSLEHLGAVYTLPHLCKRLLNCLHFFFFLGISGKSQILFALVFTTRYLDLLTSFISLYNTCMKVGDFSFRQNNFFPSLVQDMFAFTTKLFPLPGHLCRMRLCHCLPDLYEIQGYLWWKPWYL